MANDLVQFRVDSETKVKAEAIFRELGIDLPTAVRMFLARTVRENGIPFSMMIADVTEKNEFRAEHEGRR